MIGNFRLKSGLSPKEPPIVVPSEHHIWVRTSLGSCMNGSPFDVPPPSVTYHLDDKPVNGKQSDSGTENNEEENLIEVQGAQKVVNRVLCVAA